MAIKPFEILANISRAREIAAVLARNGFADLLQKFDLPPGILKAFGKAGSERLGQWARIRKVLEELGPTFVKFGQLLSMRPDVVPQPLIDELLLLQERVPPQPYEDVRPILEEGFGCPLSEIFGSFEEKAEAGASMAQVHFATLKTTGDRVAVKVQRPGIEKVIDADFDLLLWFLRQANERIEELRPFDLPGVAQTMREGLERELDFRREARNMTFFEAENAFSEEIRPPKAYEEFSSKRVLVMERIDGRRVADLTPGSDEAKRFARIGSKSLFNQILISGFFHADPHAGNIKITDEGKLCLLDWGLTGQLTRRMRYGLMDLFLAFVNGKPERVTQVAIALGDSGEPVDRRSMEREVMMAMRQHYDPKTGKGEIGRAILQLLYAFGRNGINLAKDFSMMAKAILCVEETGKKLDPQFSIRDEFKPVLETLMRERRNPIRLAKEAQNTVMQGLDYLQNLPEELQRFFKKVESNKLSLNLQHKGLEGLDETISDASNKITLGIIIGCLIVGSSLIITTAIPPYLFGYPIIGLLGFVLSMLLGAWVAFDILRGGKR